MSEFERVVVKRETWRNASRGVVVVIKIDQYGSEVLEDVRPGQVVYVSADERVLNNNRTYRPEDSVFVNGRLEPVKLLDDETAAEVAANPNIRTDEDLMGILRIHWKKFPVELESITNIDVLNRLYNLALASDSPPSITGAIRSKIIELNPFHAFDDDLAEVDEEERRIRAQKDSQRAGGARKITRSATKKPEGGSQFK